MSGRIIDGNDPGDEQPDDKPAIYIVWLSDLIKQGNWDISAFIASGAAKMLS